MRRLLPILVATGAALVHLALILRAALSHTRGEFSYPLDDAYIHLAIARHIAFDGVYGVTKYAFTAASSSVVWPWLLAGAMRVVGDRLALPLVLNALAAIALLVVVGRAMEREAPTLSAATRTFVLLGLVFLIPLATLTMLGMEHVLHMVLTIAFVFEAARVISGEPTKRGSLLILAAALVATRYEGAFPVGIAVVLLAARKRFGLATSLAVAGLAPIVLFGLYSIAHGSLFLPNSVALKRQHLALHDLSDVGDLLGGNVLNTISWQSYLLPLAFGTVALFVREVHRSGAWTRDAVRLLLAFGTTIAHVELASLGWFYRYEAYLIALDVVVIVVALAPLGAHFSLRARWSASKPGFLAGALACLVILAPLSVRALAAQAATPTACRNIYEQQIQTARFLARYFPDDVVAVNDIGAVAYYRSGRLMDLEGLANIDVAKAKSLRLEKPLDRSQLAAFTAGVPVAVVYDDWFPSVPTSWVRVGRLKIGANRVCASPLVSIYATSGDEVPRVLAALDDFAPSLPEEVRRIGRWTEAPPSADLANWRADTGDALRVESADALELPPVVWVGDDGYIGFPPGIGEVKARGLSLDQLDAVVRGKLGNAPDRKGTDTAVRLNVLEERSCHVWIAGKVILAFEAFVECGAIPVSHLLKSAGATPGLSVPYIWRSDDGGVPRRVDFDSPAAAASEILRGGDIVIVP